MSAVNAPLESAKADGRAEPTRVQVASVEVGHGIAADCRAIHPTETSHAAAPHSTETSDAAVPHSTETSYAAPNSTETSDAAAPHHASTLNASRHSAVVNSAAKAAWPSSSSSVNSSVNSSVPSSLDGAVQVFQLPLAAGRDGAAFAADTSHQGENAATVPVIVIDHFYPDVAALRAAACEPSAEFVRDAANFYPGARRQAPAQYQQFLSKLQPLLQEVYGHTPWGGPSPWQVLQAAFALTSTPPDKLRPIQMLPHFDTVSPTTLALVHYLVGPEHGGTSFYRHRSSGLSCITEQTLPAYGAALKQQAIAARLHEHPRYQAGDCALFQRIGQVSAAVNRVAIYPAHLLHSGDILQADRLSPDPREGRLTVSCLLQR